MDECKWTFKASAEKPGLFATGVIILVFGMISVIPAYSKMVSRKSSEGVSMPTLMLTNVQQALMTWNVLILKFPQIMRCDTVGFWLCQANLIVLYQVCSNCVLQFPLYFIGMQFSPKEEEKAQFSRSWMCQCLFLFVGTAIVTFWSFLSDCGASVTLVGNSSGLLSTVLCFARFQPQLYTSYKFRGAGSISYTTYFITGFGGWINTYFQIYGSKEGLTTVLATAASNLMRTVIFCMCFYFDFCAPVPLNGHKPLLEADSEQQSNKVERVRGVSLYVSSEAEPPDGS